MYKIEGWVVGSALLVACAASPNSESTEEGMAAPPSGSPTRLPLRNAPDVEPPSELLTNGVTAIRSLDCGELSETNSSGVTTRMREVYYPDAINMKLRRFPQLAQATGLSTVDDCEQSREFMRHYRALAESQPELFANPVKDELARIGRAESEDVAAAIEGSAAANSDVAVAKQSILNGTTTTSHYATVYLTDNFGASCSGIQISKFHILTSAHCLEKTQQGWARAGVWRQMCNGTSCTLQPTPYSDMWVFLQRYPGYAGNGDYPDDIAILTIYHVYDDGVTLIDPAKAGYDSFGMRIWLGSLTANQAFDVYGYGFLNNAQQGFGTLRSGRMNIATPYSDWFWATVTNQGVCKGDSGGPAVVNSNKAAGLPTQYSGVGVCPDVGGYVVWSSIAPKIGWLESAMAYPLGTGFTCTRYGSGASLYARCW